jgi:uncharacterized repeat protein (TIGR01451 family)
LCSKKNSIQREPALVSNTVPQSFSMHQSFTMPVRVSAVLLALLLVVAGQPQPGMTAIPRQADLLITTSALAGSVTPGGELTYRSEFMNLGPDYAQDFEFTDAIPPNTTFESLRVAGQYSTGNGESVPFPFCITPPVGGTGAVTCTFLYNVYPSYQGSLEATFTLVVRVNSNAVVGSVITNSAFVSSPTTDPNPVNNRASATAVVGVPDADLAVSLSDSPDPVQPRRLYPLTYTIVVSNSGPGEARGVVLGDELPANTTFGSFVQDSGPAFTLTAPPAGSGSAVTATIETFAPGARATFRLLLVVDADTPEGSVIVNTANVSASTPDAFSINNSATTTTHVTTLPLPTCCLP